MGELQRRDLLLRGAVVAGIIRSMTRWEDLDSWIMPSDRFFTVGHYDWPQIDQTTWQTLNRIDTDQCGGS